MIATLGWTLNEWLHGYSSGMITPRVALHQLRNHIDANDVAWIYLVSADELDAQLNALEQLNDDSFPLKGIPFAVKDNIDVAGIPTTAACPAFTYIPTVDATAVARLKKAGAIVLGKTNLDQFATGLVGTRSPYGAVPNSFNPDYVSGGSSSGSATTVARGLVPFSLGTDTAGSGRVPAGFNNIVGLKPTKGRFSAKGVVPACRSLDCVSIFALTVADAKSIADLLESFDAADSFSRKTLGYSRYFSAKPRLGIPTNMQWFDDKPAQAAWDASLKKLAEFGAEIIPMDFGPMYALAQLLYGGPWVAERYAALADFIQNNAQQMNETVRSIIEKAKSFSAIDTFAAEYQRAELAREIQIQLSTVDALLVPTAPCHPRIKQVMEEPISVNSQLGTYTNFVNLADCCALALPAAMRSDGLPFGITLIAPAWQDAALAAFGQGWQDFIELPLGCTDRKLPTRTEKNINPPKDYVRVAVVGAHLSGMPLNSQLQERNAIFVESTFSANNYRLFALPNTTPPKPGLIRTAEGGAAIAVELWDVPLKEFGSFVALIPAPLGIGTLTLQDGREVKGFICEAIAIEGATDITHLGGWRAYILSRAK